jgi:phosphate transport system protein
MRDTLTQVITQEPSRAFLALSVLFAAKYLERVSDHVVNIAERVYFLETGVLHQLAGSHAPNSETGE